MNLVLRSKITIVSCLLSTDKCVPTVFFRYLRIRSKDVPTSDKDRAFAHRADRKLSRSAYRARPFSCMISRISVGWDVCHPGTRTRRTRDTLRVLRLLERIFTHAHVSRNNETRLVKARGQVRVRKKGGRGREREREETIVKRWVPRAKSPSWRSRNSAGMMRTRAFRIWRQISVGMQLCQGRAREKERGEARERVPSRMRSHAKRERERERERVGRGAVDNRWWRKTRFSRV